LLAATSLVDSSSKQLHWSSIQNFSIVVSPKAMPAYLASKLTGMLLATTKTHLQFVSSQAALCQQVWKRSMSKGGWV
jgi:hypothetical protein